MPLRKPLVLALLAVTATAVAGVARAAEAESDRGVFTAQWENDLLAGTDRHYTNGIRFSYVSPSVRDQLPWAADALEWLYPFDRRANARFGVALGQSIFTPGDIATPDLIVDDRPYAGWLYLGFSLHAEATQPMWGAEVDFLDTLQLNVGVVGPWSLAEQTQTFVHDLINVQEPEGWDNQLDNEPGFALILERKWRTPPANVAGVEFDALPSVTASLGNVQTSAGVAAMVRFGDNLTVDYGPPNISSNLTGREFFERVQGGFAWYVFAGASGRAVAHNIFLDGNTFESSHSVDKKYVVGDLQAGAAVIFDNWRLAFTYLLRSKEFDGQDEPDRFGALSLSVRF